MFPPTELTLLRNPRGLVRRGEDDLLRYAHTYPHARPILVTCIEITRRRTLSSNFLNMALDHADYYHCTYRLNGTKTGRFASEGADEGGPQGQIGPTTSYTWSSPTTPNSTN